MPLGTLSPVAARELVHLLILRELIGLRGGPPVIAKGGVNLRLFFGSVRYSEDMDLDGMHAASPAIRNCLKGIFEDRAFTLRLQESGIRGLDPGEGPNKDTETTFRYKFGVIVGGVRYPTKVEVSFRERHADDLPRRSPRMATTSDPTRPFDEVVAPQAISSGHFQLDIPADWQLGPSTFGGLVLSGMARAMEASVSSERTLRSLTAELCGPVQPGEAELRVEALRTGSGVSTTACRLIQNGEVQAHAVGVFGKARTPERDRVTLTPPHRPDWRSLAPLLTEPPPWPRFTPMFEYRVSAFPPWRGASEARAEGWIRLRYPGARRDAAFAIACIDSWWPALFAVEHEFRPMATVAFTFHLCGTLEGLDPEAPLFYRAHAPVVREGYSTEFRELWGEDGRLVAMNLQTFVILK